MVLRLLMTITLLSWTFPQWAPAKSVVPAPDTESISIRMTVDPVIASLPAELSSSVSSGKARALLVRVENHGAVPARLLWADFLARRSSSDRWVGGWWEPAMALSEKMGLLVGSPSVTAPNFIAPGSSVEYTLVDPWEPDLDRMEYKFACLVSIPSGATALLESPPTATSSVPADRSGVEVVTSGVSTALAKLLQPSSSPPPVASGSLGVAMIHSAAGPVEISKSSSLKKEASEWLEWSSQSPQAITGKHSPALLHVYRTEVVNNESSPMRLVMMEVANPVGERWLTGYGRPPVISEQWLVSAGYLEKTDDQGSPSLEEMEDSWIPPGARAIFPSMWHPPSSPPSTPSSSSSSTGTSAARWRAILVDSSGAPSYAEALTPSDLPLSPVLAPAEGEASEEE